MSDYKYITLRDNPELKASAASWLLTKDNNGEMSI